MKQILTLITILLYSFMAYTQTIQSGIVQEYNEKEKKTPLSGVEIDVSKAASTLSDVQGNFDLEFLTLKPGEFVHVSRIEKANYEIFNKQALEQWNINPDRPFVVIMCRSDRIKKIRDNYERLTSENFAIQLEKETSYVKKLLADGKILKEEFEKKLMEIQKNYIRQLNNIDSYIERFASIDLSELSAGEQEILDLVQLGSIDMAVQRYDALNLKQKLIDLFRDRASIRESIRKLQDKEREQVLAIDSLYAIYDRQIDVLLLKGGAHNCQRIAQEIKEIASIDSVNISWMTKSAVLAKNYLADYPLSLNLLQKSLTTLDDENNSNLIFKAILLNDLGMVYDAMGDKDKALTYYTNCLDIFDEMDCSNHPVLAVMYNNLGSLYHTLGNCSKALDCHEKALLIYQSMPGLYETELAASFNNIGSVYQSLGDLNKAEEYYVKSLNIRKKMFGDKHPYVADSYNNIGTLYNSFGNTLSNTFKAWECFCKALDIYESTYGKEHPLVATAYNNIGSIYNTIHDYDKALEYHSYAKDIIEKIFGSNHPDLAVIYLNIGYVYKAMDKFEKAKEYFYHAQEILKYNSRDDSPEMDRVREILDNLEMKEKDADLKNR